MQLNGKVAVVTGGARGIGKSIASAFAERGATLALLDLNQGDLDATCAEFAAQGVKVSGHALNVAKEDEVIRALDAVVAAHGRLDVLVNNAGIAGPTARVEDTELAGWEQTIAVNLTGPFLCTRRAVPLLKAAGGGSIVNLSSAAGRLGFPLRTPYSASKFGVIGLTQSWAMELGPSKIRVNAILPGIVAGERQERVIAAKAQAYGIGHEEMRERLLSKVSLRAMVTAQDIANQIIFICSPAGASISGQSLSVCGNVEHLG
jgi:NAD(P)-dependent dehydrogenase (short-subunit alcohol dehydrogenase family)